MFHVILFEPEIPPNTGNIIRLCANTNSQLHLIEPLGFTLDEKPLRRAGLDYHDLVRVKQYPNLQACLNKNNFRRVFALSSKATHCYSDAKYDPNDAFMFGPETRGLPPHIKDLLPCEQQLRLPQHTNARSLNLSNSVSIMLYEAWRQLGFSLDNT